MIKSDKFALASAIWKNILQNESGTCQSSIISTTVCEKNKRLKHDAHFYNDIWSWKKNQNWPNFLNSHQKQILFAFWISISFHLFVFFRQVQCQLTEKKKKSYGQINQISRIYQWKQIFVEFLLLKMDLRIDNSV